MISSILISLAEQGFNSLVVWQGCGGHNLRNVVQVFNQSNQFHAKAYLPVLSYEKLWCRYGNPLIPGGHADSFSTSIALYLKPQMVREKLIPMPETQEVNWNDPALDFSKYSTTGVIGDARHGTKKIGQKIWTELVKQASIIIKNVADEPGNRLANYKA